MAAAAKKNVTLKKEQEISNLFKKARLLKSNSFDLFYLQDKSQHFFVGVARNAYRTKVERNRIKRRLREVYRLRQGELPLNMSIALVGKQNCLRAKWHQLCAEFDCALKKMK